MRGGKREGAGRKASEPTVRVSVPIGVLEVVQGLIAAYKAGSISLNFLNDNQIINDSDSTHVSAEDLNNCHLIKDGISESVQENPAIDLNDCLKIEQQSEQDLQNYNAILKQQNIDAVVAGLELLPQHAKEMLIETFGSIYQAAESDIKNYGQNSNELCLYVHPDKQHLIPSEFQPFLHPNLNDPDARSNWYSYDVDNNITPDVVNNNAEIQTALRKIEKMSSKHRKILKKNFGSLYNAAKHFVEN